MSTENENTTAESKMEIARTDAQILRYQQLVAAHDYSLRATDVWGIEVIKALFLLNAAGLAGVFTLAQIGGIVRKDLPFLAFSIGILLAVVSMTFGRYTHAAAADGWQTSTELYATTFNENDTALQNAGRVECLEFAQTLAACGSAACCLWAGYTLYGLFL